MTQFLQTDLKACGIPASMTGNLHGSGLQSDQSISRIRPEPAASTVSPRYSVPRI